MNAESGQTGRAGCPCVWSLRSVRGAELQVGSSATSARQQGEHCPALEERLVLWLGLEQRFCCSGLSSVWLLRCSPLPKALTVSRQSVVCVAEMEPHLLSTARATPLWQPLSPQSVGVWHKRPQ